MMNKIFANYDCVFIDCGGHKGESAKLARKVLGDDALIVTFEPNADLHDMYNAQEFQNNFHLVKCGVSTNDEKKSFFKNVGGTQCFTSQLEMIGRQQDILETTTIECVNLSNWIRQNLSMTQKIFLKLDVEGSEYSILNALVEDGTLSEYIDELHVDFHAHRMFLDARNYHVSTQEEFCSIVIHCDITNLTHLSMHNDTIFKILSVTKNLFHWDALEEKTSFSKLPVYYLTYTPHKFDRKTLNIK